VGKIIKNKNKNKLEVAADRAIELDMQLFFLPICDEIINELLK
jgi:hypothetical protein